MRIWGYVDDIYIPSKQKTYAPFIISTSMAFSAGPAAIGSGPNGTVAHARHYIVRG